MRIAIVHELWGAGAGRCARDLQNQLGRSHEVEYFPQNAHDTVHSVLHGLNEFKPAIVNCHSFYGGLPYSILAEISRRYPTCFTVHDPRPIGTMEVVCWTCDHNDWCIRCPMIRSRWRKLIRNTFFRQRIQKRLCHLRCAKDMAVVTPSEWMASRLKNQELKRFRFVTIPNGIDLERFRPLSSDRAKYNLPTDAIVLLHLAWHAGPWAINHRKGLQYLAEAFVKYVVPHFPSAVLAVAGESFAPNHPNVRPLGMIEQEELPSLLSSVDIFVLPTLADNFPYTILEAMACGKAVVASCVGGVPEQVVDGETGFLVPSRDSSKLGEALIRLLSDPKKIMEFGKAGRYRAERLFAMPKFIQTYEALFEKLAIPQHRDRTNSRASVTSVLVC